MTERSAFFARVQAWLAEEERAAAEYLPWLLALPIGALREELASEGSYRTITLLRKLLENARRAFDRYPIHSHELTSVVVDNLSDLVVPPEFRHYLAEFKGDAWKEHANALSGLMRPEEALEATKRAREFYESIGGDSDHKLAILDLVDALALQKIGRTDGGLTLTRAAAMTLERYGDSGGYVDARIIEGWLLYSLHQFESARTIWKATVTWAEKENNRVALARLHQNLGQVACALGDIAEARRRFRRAVRLLEELEMTAEQPKVRWGLARILLTAERYHDALSEFYKVQREFLRVGNVYDAALASLEIADLLIVIGRTSQAVQLAGKLVRIFAAAGMHPNALRAFGYVREAAQTGQLNKPLLDDVRRYLFEFEQNPMRPFASLPPRKIED